MHSFYKVLFHIKHCMLFTLLTAPLYCMHTYIDIRHIKILIKYRPLLIIFQLLLLFLIVEYTTLHFLFTFTLTHNGVFLCYGTFTFRYTQIRSDRLSE